MHVNADILSSRTPFQAAIQADFLPISHIRPNKNFLKGYKPASRSAVKGTAAGTIRPHKNLLRYRDSVAYTQAIAETAATRFDSRNHTSAQPRLAAFLCVSPSCASFYGRALAGEPNGSPGACVTGLSTLLCARSPHLTVGSGLTAHTRGRIMRQPHHARTGQDTTTLIQQITRDAIKRAAVARTYADALDITGAALLAVAFLAKSGVQHG